MHTARFIVTHLLFVICYLLFVISPVAAQTNPYTVPNTNPDVPKNLHTWTQNVMIEVMSAMSCQLTGIDPTDRKGKCLGVDPKTGNIGFIPSAGSGQVGGGGAIGVAGKMIAMLYTPPLHSGDYFKYLADNFGIAKPAQAATGFEGLRPIQKLWVGFRDVVYLLFVIIFIVIGLAIMLRVRIDPRTVMTIQNQIPRIIIGLLLLTFSFAIAGFLIDLMYVVIFLSYELISGAASPGSLDKLNPLALQDQSPFHAANQLGGIGGIGRIAGKIAKAMFFVVENLSGEFIDGLISSNKTFLVLIGAAAGMLMGVVNPFAGVIVGLFGIIGGATGITGKLVEEVASNILGALSYPIVFLIVAVALLIALFRLWLSLIMAYVGILLNVVLAPFWIAASLLPGSTIGFGAWLRSIISNLAVFPATIVMFLLAKVFIDSFGAKPSDTAFAPPLLGNLPGTNIFGDLIGLGIILMTPNVVAMVKAALKAPSLPAGGILTGFAAGARVVTGTVSGGIAARMASQEYIPDPNAQRGFRRRGPTGAIIGRLFGR